MEKIKPLRQHLCPHFRLDLTAFGHFGLAKTDQSNKATCGRRSECLSKVPHSATLNVTDP